MVSSCICLIKDRILTNVNSYSCNRNMGTKQTVHAGACKMTVASLLQCILLALCLHTGTVQAQTADPTSNAVLQNKLKSFLEPEMGLNNEIRAGLARIEQTCAFTNKTKSTTPGPLFSKSALVQKELSTARMMANEQQAIADKAIAEFRSTHTLNMNACSALPALLRVTEQCVRYQTKTEAAQMVSHASQTYFAETRARFNSYEAAVDLEARGCTRPDFAHKLWAAEQAHIVPKLKTSGQQLSDLLK